MDMDFAVSRPLVRRLRLISGFCPSTRTFAPRFLQTPPRDGSPCAFASPSPPSGWAEDFHLRAAEHAQHTTNPLRRGGAGRRFCGDGAVLMASYWAPVTATIDTPSAAQGAIRRRQFSCRAVILGTRATNMAQASQAPATSRHANLRATGCCHITLLRRCHRWSHRNPILASMVGHNERRRRDRTCSCGVAVRVARL